MTTANTTCIWCGRLFATRRTGGSPQRFCRSEHRNAFWTAARRWAERAVAIGVVTIAELRAGATCTLSPPRQRLVHGRGYGGDLTVMLDVPARAVAMLRRAGWLAGPASQDGVSDAIIAVIDAAIRIGLRPPPR
jgi:hypothetical protein